MTYDGTSGCSRVGHPYDDLKKCHRQKSENDILGGLENCHPLKIVPEIKTDR